MRLELHQHQPPTTNTGTTYNIEMYQCIRQASAAIPMNATTPSPRFLRRRLGTAGAGRGAVASGISSSGADARIRDHTSAAPAHE